MTICHIDCSYGDKSVVMATVIISSLTQWVLLTSAINKKLMSCNHWRWMEDSYISILIFGMLISVFDINELESIEW